MPHRRVMLQFKAHRALLPVFVAIALLAGACDSAKQVALLRSDAGMTADGSDSGPTDSGSTDTDANGDADVDASAGQDSGPDEIDMDCSSCYAVGNNMQNLLCAFDLCDMNAVQWADYVNLLPLEQPGPANPVECKLQYTREAVEHFGELNNDLGPASNGSYVLMATGIANSYFHSAVCTSGFFSDVRDRYSNDIIYDAFEWRITLKAPENARSFQFDYVFFSAEYDELVSSSYSDKFYAVLRAKSTQSEPVIINFSDCREPGLYSDFECSEGHGCEEGEPQCYISINSAFSECCWYPRDSQFADDPHAPPCPDGRASTDISGTGFECADSIDEELGFPESFEVTGSSTGWLRTSWPIKPGETFSLTFHIHDTADGFYDSEVILDRFRFLTYEAQGTVKLP